MSCQASAEDRAAVERERLEPREHRAKAVQRQAEPPRGAREAARSRPVGLEGVGAVARPPRVARKSDSSLSLRGAAFIS